MERVPCRRTTSSWSEAATTGSSRPPTWPAGAADRRARAAGHRRRRGRQRAPVRSGLHGHVAVLRRLAAAADPGARPGPGPARLPRLPAGPVLRAARATARYLQLPSDPGAAASRSRSSATRTPTRSTRWDAWLDRPRPRDRAAAQRDPARRSAPASPADLARQALPAAPAARASTRARPSTSPGCSRRASPTSSRTTSSPTRCRACSRSPASSARGRGRARAGTAYVMVHHHIGDIGDGQIGALGLPARRHGRGHARRWRRPPGRSASRSAPRPRSRGSPPATAASPASCSSPARRSAADTVITTAHPQISFLRLRRPARPARRLRRGHRALEDAQRHRQGQPRGRPAAASSPPSPGFDPEVHGGTIVLAESPRRHRGRLPGRGRRAARRRCRSPTSASPPCSTTRSPPRATTSCRCSPSGCRTPGTPSRTRHELEAYADRVVARMDEVAPGFTDSVLHRQVIGPYEMEHEYGLVGGNIFHGELTAGQMFHARPAAGYADLRTPIARALPGRLGHARRRWRHRHPRPQRRPPGARRPPRTAAASAAGRAPCGRAADVTGLQAGAARATTTSSRGVVRRRARPGAARTVDLRRAGSTSWLRPADRELRRAARRRRRARRVRPASRRRATASCTRTPTSAGTAAPRSSPSTRRSRRRSPCAVGGAALPVPLLDLRPRRRLLRAPHTDDVDDFDPAPSRLHPVGRRRLGRLPVGARTPARRRAAARRARRRCPSGCAATRWTRLVVGRGG